METNELLQAISDMMDRKLEPLKSDLQTLKDEQSAMKSDLQFLKDEQSAIKSDLQFLKDEQSAMKSDLQFLKDEQSAMKSDLKSLKVEQSAMKSDLQKQMKRTERNLKAEIVESENLILDEVERVHHILDKHKEDKTVHTA